MPRTAHLLANAASGQGTGAALADIAREVCGELGCPLVAYDIGDPAGLDAQADRAAKAAAADGGVVIAAGGDGTLRSVAERLHGKDVPMAIVPCGTFNYFARGHRIPEDPREALRLALTGEIRAVRLGEINGRVFLINATFGLYERALRERERRLGVFGRNRLTAVVSTVVSLFSRHSALRLEIVRDGVAETRTTPMVFIGNNALQLRGVAWSMVQCLREDALGLLVLKPLGKRDVLRILFRGLARTIERDERVDGFCVDSLTIYGGKPRHAVALDGEPFRLTAPLRVRALPAGLRLVLPPTGP